MAESRSCGPKSNPVTVRTLALEDELGRARAVIELLVERLRAMSEVPCVDDWGRHPMRCMPRDPCSFCRARATLEAVEIYMAKGRG